MNPLEALAKLSEVGEMAVQLQESMEAAQALASELATSRDTLKAALEGLDHELTKQRMVFLRLLYSPDILLSAGPDGIAKLLANEERFRAEYDVLRAFELLATGSKEGT